MLAMNVFNIRFEIFALVDNVMNTFRVFEQTLLTIHHILVPAHPSFRDRQSSVKTQSHATLMG